MLRKVISKKDRKGWADNGPCSESQWPVCFQGNGGGKNAIMDWVMKAHSLERECGDST